MKVAVVTACGSKKRDSACPAHRLYKSARIAAVYNCRGENDMFILSAKHGLIPAEKMIEPYDMKMDEQRSQELVPEITKVVENYDVIVYFKGGAGKLYVECIEKACDNAGVKLDSFGYANLGGIKELQGKLDKANGRRSALASSVSDKSSDDSL